MNNSNILDDVLDRCGIPIPFNDNEYPTADVSQETYSPRRVTTYNLHRAHHYHPTSIQGFLGCMPTPVQVPRYRKPSLGAEFPPAPIQRVIRQSPYASILPILIATNRAQIDIQRYDVVSERNSFRKIATNSQRYVISVQKCGRTLFLRRHDDRLINLQDFGYRFEQLCTPDYDLHANYYQLIEGRLGDLTTLISAETDAVAADEQPIELKCKLNGMLHPRDRLDFWLQAFLSGVQNIKIGRPSCTNPVQLLELKNQPVADLIDDDEKRHALRFLHNVLTFLRQHVQEDEVYLLARRSDDRTGTFGLYLYRVRQREDKSRLIFISARMTRQLINSTAIPIRHHRRRRNRTASEESEEEVDVEDNKYATVVSNVENAVHSKQAREAKKKTYGYDWRQVTNLTS